MIRVIVASSLFFLCACTSARKTTSTSPPKPPQTDTSKINIQKTPEVENTVPVNASLQEITKDIKREIQGGTAERKGDEINITFNEEQWNVFLFTGNTALISTAGQRSLDRLSAILLKNDALLVRIEAHTDDAGAAAENMLLSDRRANAIARYMMAKGINPHRIMIRWFGESRPKIKGSSAGARSANERIEIILKPDDKVK